MMKLYYILKPVSILMLLAGVLSFGACKKIVYHQLSDDDMAWLVYKNNEINTFANSAGETVRFMVTLRMKAYYDNGGASNEFTSASFEQLNDTAAYYKSDSYGQLYIYKPDANGLLVTLSWPHFPLKATPLTGLPHNTVTINGVLYDDVFILDATGLTDVRFYVNTIWYSQSRGVIQFAEDNGEIWVRNI